MWYFNDFEKLCQIRILENRHSISLVNRSQVIYRYFLRHESLSILKLPSFQIDRIIVAYS